MSNNEGQTEFERLEEALAFADEHGQLPDGLNAQDQKLIFHIAQMKILRHLDDDLLNLKAWAALDGASVDWAADVAALLRSDTPIHPIVRNRMADALEGKAGLVGTQMILSGGGGSKDFAIGLTARRQRVEIGRWIEDQIAKGCLRKDAIQAASDHFAASIEKCEAALTYTRKLNRYLAENGHNGLRRRSAEDGYHAFDLNEERERKGRSKRGKPSTKAMEA